ncbi:Peptidyl-tRNA hydrolase [Buchnera aphidicola (Cinara kochiana kochiana)]|uniref:Peptidyl-tRNA hydrolase n=1 Tax=Buchnera aphidicola (Cinara kochiana kochiana) TaxID=2518976 RepID=A0A451D5I4_9GAMM|nr:aminoacyl-tRNA hydrolase [Buchnera aphidicola]VFP81047.1 Peptidyl-tRNA hydrolase [Buchnera aphidicola (Cinara kochiana kochiana)]
MSTIKMIVGLGNSLHQYSHTRHNVGHWFVNMLSDFYKISFNFKKKFLGYVSYITVDNNKIYFLRPNLLMNVSGHSVYALSYFYKIALSDILIVRDELDLLPGVLKIKVGVNHNGHNGVKSIVSCFTDKNKFMQLCIGIGRPEQKKYISKFVLNPPNAIEMNMIKKAMFKFILLTKNKIYHKKFLANKIITVKM